MTVLVTGSAGHLGEAVMRYLRAAGRSSLGLDVKPSPFTDQVGSICDKRFVTRCIRSAQAVVHAATLHKPHVATHSWQDFIDAKRHGNAGSARGSSGRRHRLFVYVSTTSTFGLTLTPVGSEPAAWITENLIPKPKNVYGVSKLMAESLCELVHKQRSLP